MNYKLYKRITCASQRLVLPWSSRHFSASPEYVDASFWNSISQIYLFDVASMLLCSLLCALCVTVVCSSLYYSYIILERASSNFISARSLFREERNHVRMCGSKSKEQRVSNTERVCVRMQLSQSPQTHKAVPSWFGTAGSRGSRERCVPAAHCVTGAVLAIWSGRRWPI